MSAISNNGTSLANLSSSTGSGSSATTPGLIQAATGPVSGINYQNLINALTAESQQQVSNINSDITALQNQESDYETLEANLASLTSAAQTLGQASTFQTFQVQQSDNTQLTATASNAASPGSYTFQTLQLASTQVDLSQGYANENQQTLGTGTLTISNGGGLNPQTLLSALNGNQGIQRGQIQITDAAGHTATIDLSNAYTVTDVLNAINDNGVADVTASTSGGHLEITDNSGGSGTLSVTNVDGDQTATDLGIAQSSTSGSITGQNVYQATSATLLSQINDGNGIDAPAGQPSLDVTLSNGTQLQVDLNGAQTVGDVINDINNATGNNGTLVASIVNGGIQLTDNSGGSGTLSVSDATGASVVQALGLNVSASGNTISGAPLLAGINSVLLQNLNGGQGITQTGQIQLQDRTGLSATINLTGATSLDQVVNAINNATTTGGQKLHLLAQVDSTGNGIEVTDTSGSTADNLVIQDVGSGTLATQLGIAVNSATSSVDSGPLNLQYVNDATSLSTYGPGGTGVPDGTFTITDSAGHQATINITSSDQTIGDVINAINSASGIDVHAQLNSTGDGFTVTDLAGGSGQLTIADQNGNTATDLGIAGTGTADGQGQSQIDSRQATVINITSSDTLDSLVKKINQSGIVTASVVNDGSPYAPYHLALTSTTSGQAGQFHVHESGVNLGLQTTTPAQNALLKVGSGSNAVIQSSSTNTFADPLPGISVQTNAVGQSPDTVTVSQNQTDIVNDVQSFVTAYNNYVQQAQSFSAYNATSNTAAPLEGSPTLTAANNVLSSLVGQSFSSGSSSIQTLVDLGITVNSDGTLSFNQTQLQNELTSDPQAVSNFFTTATTGFGAVAQSTINAITSSANGTFTLADNAIQDSITSYQNRIKTLNQLLTDQQQQLTNQFAALEAFLSEMQSQQQQISLIKPLNVSSNSSGSGSSVL